MKTQRRRERAQRPRIRPRIARTPASVTVLDDAQRRDGTLEPLTVRMDQAVRIIGLGETFLRDRIRDGTLKWRKHGRALLIDYASLKALALGSPERAREN